FHCDKRRQRLGQGREVPVSDRDLVLERVATAVVGMVADMAGIEIVEKSVGTEIEGDAEDRHIVGVHYSVAEAIGLPACDHLGGTFDHAGKEGTLRLGFFQALGEMAGQYVVEQLPQGLMLAGVVEELEMTEAHMAGCQAQQHGVALLAVAIELLARSGYAVVACYGTVTDQPL